MNAILTAASVAMLATLGGCSQRSAPGETSGASNSAAAAPSEQGPRKAGAVAGCADAIAVDLDRSETAMVDWRSFPPDRLEAFRKRAAEAFRAGAAADCREGKVAAALKPIRKLLLQSGSGATEPVFYQEDGKDDSLIFQYAFVEARLEVPDRAGMTLGLRCWADPDWKACEEMGD